MRNQPPFSTFKNPYCKGSLSIGTGCGSCEKCVWERNEAARELPEHEAINEASIAKFKAKQGTEYLDDLAAVTRERDALKKALEFAARHDGSELEPSHRAIVKQARETLRKLESGELRK